ncbi:MAG: T9SS type A sorting domain-containing protein [Flavobacteriales bacterium]|nr:T9SS type A sorting domain-containing protein [Flavobacteriales bacterium]
MKKQVLTIAGAIVFGMFTVQAQQPAIPNGNLESWTALGSAEEPTGGFLKSLNQITNFPGNPPITCFKEGNAHGGQFCAKIVSANFASLGIFIPGALGTITPIANPVSAQLAEPFTAKPEKIRAWIKYTPVTGDSAEIFGYLFKTTSGVRETLATASMVYTQAISNWTEVEIPFVYSNATATPDSASLLFVSSAGYNFDNLFLCQGSANSTMFIDDVEFIYPAGISENLGNNDLLNVFPNPAENMVTITYATEVQNGSVSVLDMSGREVLQTNVKGNSFQIDVASLRSGNYTLLLKENASILARKNFLKK